MTSIPSGSDVVLYTNDESDISSHLYQLLQDLGIKVQQMLMKSSYSDVVSHGDVESDISSHLYQLLQDLGIKVQQMLMKSSYSDIVSDGDVESDIRSHLPTYQLEIISVTSIRSRNLESDNDKMSLHSRKRAYVIQMIDSRKKCCLCSLTPPDPIQMGVLHR